MASDKAKHGALSALFEEAAEIDVANAVNQSRSPQSFEDFFCSVYPDVEAGEGEGSLADRFVVPPTSVLDTQQGYWKEKQTRWIPVFDPLLCEIIYRWFAPVSGGHFLDPFGDATRAIVAGCLGYEYTGFEPDADKVKAYERQALLVRPIFSHMKPPRWICADPSSLDKHLGTGELYDLIVTDLPVYHPDQATSECIARYENIFRQALAHLRQNRCAVVMARQVNGKNGFIQFTPEEVVELLTGLDLFYYNRFVLKTSGSVFVHPGIVGTCQHEMLYQFWKGEEDVKALGELGSVSGQETREAAKKRMLSPAANDQVHYVR
jgi:hypothetical protein